VENTRHRGPLIHLKYGSETSTDARLIDSLIGMKILVTADLHYALKQYDWLKSVAADFDIVVLAGDLLEISSIVDRRAQMIVVRAYIEEIAAKTRLIVCSGNHDLDIRNHHGELSARWIEDLADIGVVVDWGSLDVSGTLITVCPWWDGDGTREAIGRHLAVESQIPHEKWIWIYHAPPAENPVSWSGRRHYGDEALTAWIRQYAPDMVFSGHVHQSPFIEGGSWADRIGKTWVFNTGQQIGPTPANIALHLTHGEAIWTSMEGSQFLSLQDGPRQPYPPMTIIPDWLKAANPTDHPSEPHAAPAAG
jgi:Icc-related predicted phosphoesterase